MEEKIGEGGFGTVHLATCRENNKQYAIKYMDMTQTRKLDRSGGDASCRELPYTDKVVFITVFVCVAGSNF